MSLLEKINTTDINTTCVNCGGHNIDKPNYIKAIYDWYCMDCMTYQLDYIKSRGFRYYAFLLSGSWTSEYIKARSLKEAYQYAKRLYKNRKVHNEKVEVLRSYLRGGVDQYVLDGWYGF